MTEKQRNKRVRDRVVDMYKVFVSEVDPKNVFDLLIQKRVITIHQKREIANKATEIDCCRALLDHLLFCSNDESFIVLREALGDHYPWIVERLDQCETENETENLLDARCNNQCKMTKTELQEHPDDPVHVKLQFYVEERLKKVLEPMKSDFEIGSKILEQNLEESRKEIAKMKEQFEESRKETVEMKEQYEKSRKNIAKMEEQYRILKESFDNSLLREMNLKKELDEIKSWVKQEIGDKRIRGNAQEALNTTVKSSESQLNPLAPSPDSTKEFNRCAVVVANSAATIRMSLNRPEDVTVLQPLPGEFHIGAVAAAAVYRDSMFVCGLGNEFKDIWKLEATSSKWNKCASLIQGRCWHSVAFVDHALYICGGNSPGKALDDVETYNTNDHKCSTVGKLAYAVHTSGNCVPFKTSLYIFGGRDSDNHAVGKIQVYDTNSNTCTLLTKQMPRACAWLFGELWENSVILLGKDGCFIYEIDTQTWKARDRFKIENYPSGVIFNDDKLFVIGCGAKNDDMRWIPIANILNDEFIEWRHYAKFPNNFCGRAFAVGKLDCH